MAEPPAGPGRDLPAEYQSPWIALRLDLQAVAASLVLSSREFWRRNRQGDLPRPGFWPAAVASLFWPLLLAMALGLVVAALLVLLQPGQPPTPSGADPGASRADVPDAASPLPPTDRAASVPAEAGVVATAPEQAPEAATEAAPEPEPESEPTADPLLTAFAPLDPDHWIRAAKAEPQRHQLGLVLAAEFAVLPAGRQQQLAQAWYHQAADLGYDHLLLRDRRGRLLGRDALVGSGMILFDDGAPP